MATVHTGKLLIRFIKDWTSIIREPKIIPSPPKNYSSDFHCWYGFTDDEKPDTIKLGPCEIKEWNGKKEQEATRRIINTPIVFPHEIAESEEKDTTPNWGDITSEDTNFDAWIKQNRIKNN